MGAPSKRAKKIRVADEFNATLLRALLLPPESNGSVYAWSLSEIFSARDAQMRGHFSSPARLAASMRTDDALAVARANRLAPQRCIKVEIVPAKGARGLNVAKEAEALFGQGGVAIAPGVLADINGCLVDHGIAFATNVVTPRDDGTRVDIEVHYWPIEHVRWDPMERVYKTRVAASSSQVSGLSAFEEMPITHGDGRWIIFSTHEHEPFAQEAAVMPGSLVWARHAFAIRDWSKSSVAHGSAKVIGEMAEGVSLQGENGKPTPEAQAFAELLRSIASADAPVGIRPSGAKTEFLTNNSTAWQIFTELVLNAEKAAARIYLGTDGTLGSQGGAPGVDVQALFGVASTKVQGDLSAIERGLATGTIEVWCALNFDDSSLCPTRRYMLPDADADADRASIGTRRQAFFEDIDKARANGFDVSQKYVDEVAKAYAIDPPQLPEETGLDAPSIMLAPTDIARVVSVNEARASAGLAALTLADGRTPDPDGMLTVEQFALKKAAEAAPAPAAAPAPGLRAVQ